MDFTKKTYLIHFMLIIGNTIFSQPVDRFVKVILAADHGDWLYCTSSAKLDR